MPKTNEMLFKLGGFQYATSIDLNMGFYHIRISKNTSNLCTIILPWGKYHHNNLPMGVDNSPYIFQWKMNDLIHRFEFICAYLDVLLILTKGDWTYHVQELELTLNKLKEKGNNCNIEK